MAKTKWMRISEDLAWLIDNHRRKNCHRSAVEASKDIAERLRKKRLI